MIEQSEQVHFFGGIGPVPTNAFKYGSTIFHRWRKDVHIRFVPGDELAVKVDDQIASVRSGHGYLLGITNNGERHD
jgi:hypothetical protein